MIITSLGEMSQVISMILSGAIFSLIISYFFGQFHMRKIYKVLTKSQKSAIRFIYQYKII